MDGPQEFNDLATRRRKLHALWCCLQPEQAKKDKQSFSNDREQSRFLKNSKLGTLFRIARGTRLKTDILKYLNYNFHLHFSYQFILINLNWSICFDQFILINLFTINLFLSINSFLLINIFAHQSLFIYQYFISIYFYQLDRTLELISSKYRTRAIITRILYIFYLLIEGQKRFFRKFCVGVWLVFKSSL